MLLAVVVPAVVAFALLRRRGDVALEQLDQQFEQMMAGVTLVGRSTTVGRETLSSEERSVIERAETPRAYMEENGAL